MQYFDITDQKRHKKTNGENFLKKLKKSIDICVPVWYIMFRVESCWCSSVGRAADL